MLQAHRLGILYFLRHLVFTAAVPHMRIILTWQMRYLGAGEDVCPPGRYAPSQPQSWGSHARLWVTSVSLPLSSTSYGHSCPQMEAPLQLSGFVLSHGPRRGPGKGRNRDQRKEEGLEGTAQIIQLRQQTSFPLLNVFVLETISRI